MVLQQPWDFPFEGVVKDRVSKPDNKFILVNYIRRQPECDSGKLVENGGVDIVVIFRVESGKVAKEPLAKNYGKILLVGDQLEFGTNQFSG